MPVTPQKLYNGRRQSTTATYEKVRNRLDSEGYLGVEGLNGKEVLNEAWSGGN
ncbi:hypothetical protein [Lactiplantibacillus garii]|uniref:hypothetical protein n=1 Tax=Lactiplantibacillus garii TaxID=2306423 RepID=UPI0013151820|nr:hypothetical protein [Lactiplantibacillus garii]